MFRYWQGSWMPWSWRILRFWAEREIYGTSMSRLWAERTTCGTLYFRMLIWCPLYHLMIFSYRSGLICISAGCHLLNMVVVMLHNIHRFVNVLANALRGMFSNFGLWCPFLWGLVKLNTGSISSTCSLSPISRNLLFVQTEKCMQK